MRLIRAAAACVVAVLSLGAAPQPTTIAYRLTPVFDRGALKMLAVELSFRGDGRGRMVLELPDHSMGEHERWRYLSDFSTEGASLRAPTPATRELAYKPGAQVTLRYRVASAYAQDPRGSDENPYKGAAIRPNWFATLGDFLFATPRGGDRWPATFAWGAVPKGWTVASDLEQGPATVDAVVESTILGGRDVTVYRRTLGGGELRLAVRGHWSFDPGKLTDELARVIASQRGFWGGDLKGPFLVTLFPLTGTGSSGGTGRGDGFALYGTSDTEEASFRRTIAHEHAHSWIPARLGNPRAGAREPESYWFSEGFTEFLTQRSLVHAGLWSAQDFAADLNVKLLDYAASPTKNAPNSAIVKGFWTDPALQELPYRRGLLLALLWDYQLRKSGGGSLGKVLLAARDRAQAAVKKPDAEDNMLRALREAGYDPGADVARYVIQGETIALPRDLLAACGVIRTVTIARFDPGFDRNGSAARGVFTGVDPKGPAYAAGLRDGMKRIAREGGQESDSRVPLSYRVADAQGRQRIIRYLPAGKGRQSMQELALKPGPGCLKVLGG